MSAPWMDEVRSHAISTVAHFLGNDQLSSQSLTPTLYGLETLWTPTDKSAFFRAVAVHSRLRPDLIAAELGNKEIWEVCEYLNLLEEESKRVGPLKRLHPPPAAVEVSEAWILQEDRLAAEAAGKHDGDHVMMNITKYDIVDDKDSLAHQRRQVLAKLETPEQRALDQIIRAHEENMTLQPLQLDNLMAFSPKLSPSQDNLQSKPIVKQPSTPPKPSMNVIIDPALMEIDLSGSLTPSVVDRLPATQYIPHESLAHPTWTFMHPPPPSPSLRESYRSLYQLSSPHASCQNHERQAELRHNDSEHSAKLQAAPTMSPGWLTRSSTHPLPDISLAFPSSRGPSLSPTRSTLSVARPYTPPRPALHPPMLPPQSPLPHSYLDTFFASQLPPETVPPPTAADLPLFPELLLPEEVPSPQPESIKDMEAGTLALLSPRSRRRHQKRLYMRRRRATDRGEAAEQISAHVGRLKPGRKCSNTQVEGMVPEPGQAGPSSGSLPLPVGIKRSRSEASMEAASYGLLGDDMRRGERTDSEAPDAKKRKKSGPTKDTKAMRTMQENGIDILYLQQHGLDLFHFAALGKVCSTYANIHSGVAPALSGSFALALRAALRSFVYKLVENILVVGTLDRRSKSKTKAWRLRRKSKRGDITPQHVERALTVTQHAVFGGTERFWQYWIDCAVVDDNEKHENEAGQGEGSSTPRQTLNGDRGDCNLIFQPLKSASKIPPEHSNGQECPLRETSDFRNFYPPLVQMPTMDPTFLALFGIDCQWLDWRVPSRVEDPAIAEAWRMDESDLEKETSWELNQEDKLDTIDREQSEGVERALWTVYARKKIPSRAVLMESDEEDVESTDTEDEESAAEREPSVSDGEEWLAEDLEHSDN